MTGRLRIAVAAAVATALTATGLMRLLAPSTWVWPVIGAIMVTVASGEVARRLIRPRPLVIAVQVVFVFWYDLVALAHEAAWGGIIPGPGAVRMLGDLLNQGGSDMDSTVPGGSSTPGMTAILVLSLGALAILVDALAATYAVAPLAGLPLLALYLVPAIRVDGGYDWLAFALTAAGYTALLSAEGRERLGRWGRPLVHTTARRAAAGEDGSANEGGAPARTARVDTGPIAATGHQITMIALCAAILAPVVLPTVSSGLFGLGPDGGGGGTGPGGHAKRVNLSQTLDLKANLTSEDNAAVYTYESSDKKGHYIRTQALDRFDGTSWTSSAPPATAYLPGTVLNRQPPGMTGSNYVADQNKQVTVKVSLLADLGTNTDGPKGQQVYTLPVPYPVQSLPDLPRTGTWIFNDSDFVVADTQEYGAGLVYTANFFEPDPKRDTILDTVPVMTPELAAEDGLSPTLTDQAKVPKPVKDKADEIVAGESRPFEQAYKIMDYFAKSGGFTYDITAPPGDMVYLLQHKVGFCQTFAETMAAMARHLGIPARVALGFTNGQQKTGSDVFTVKQHDFHAWPELYFQGVGWLRFEPTVGIDSLSGGGNGQIPAYAVAAAKTSPSASASASASGNRSPGATASPNCSTEARRAGECTSDANGSSLRKKQRFGSLGWFGAVPRFFDYWLFGGSPGAIILRFVLLGALLVACVPMILRILRRRRRGRIASGRADGRNLLAPEPPDALDWDSEGGSARSRTGDDGESERVRILAAWAEVRDSATDLGYAWPPAETPRQSAERIIRQARFSHQAQDAMDRMTGLAERANYARTLRGGSGSGAAVPTGSLNEDVRTIRESLSEPVSRRTRVRATVLPPSAMAALRERREDLTGRVYERAQLTGARIRRSTSSRMRRGSGRG